MPRGAHPRLVLLAVLATALAAACARKEPKPRPDILLIVVDTLRADHLGCYGYGRPTSPNVDGFARGARLFERAVTPIPRTTQAVASIMTGRYPASHGVRQLRDRLPDDERPLAELLGEAGYSTLGVQGNAVLEGMVDQGFDRMETKPYRPGGVSWFTAAETTERALAMLAKAPADRPVLLYALYFDPHMPYRPAELRFDQGYVGRFQRELPYLPPVGRMFYFNDFSPREREHAVALYDAEIHSVDAQISRLLAALEQRRRPRIVVFTADHGEALGEHGVYYDHGAVLHEPTLHVPLLIAGDGFEPGRDDRVVSLVDIAPTLLGRLKIPVAGLRIDGRDLGRPDGWKRGTRAVHSESGAARHPEVFRRGLRAKKGLAGRHRAVTRGKWRAVLVPLNDTEKYELYDLEADPGQLVDLYPGEPAPDLVKQIKKWNRDLHDDKPPPPLSEEDRARLRSLGYL
jgi:arylsulfatase A-like enzyme